jgi:cytochrome c553
MKVLAGALLIAAVSLTAQKPDFQRDIEPVLRARCALCHGASIHQNNLRLDSLDSVMQGGSSGAVIVPGNARESLLVKRASSLDPSFMMPPAGVRLTAKEIALVQAWIDSLPPAPKAVAAVASTHWAFQPIAHPDPPVVRNAAWARNPIDRFVLARLEKEKIAPSPEANRATLLRRLSLDLTGLPPTPAEVAEFLADKRPDAYERAVDRLLASPHYAEKWARSWLDLAHYSDSDGYEKDQVRKFAWRYRNWLIDAIAADMPFDEFTRQQLAGDLLPNANADTRVATGFLRQTLTNREAGNSQEEIRFEQLVDRTSTVSTTWIGLTLGCAQCHNHKFDPILQKDFYQFMTFFHQAAEQDIDAPLAGEMGPYLQARPEYDRKRAELWKEFGVAELEASWVREMRDAIRNPGPRLDWDFNLTQMRAMVDYTDKMLLKDPVQLTAQESDRLARYFIANPGPEIGKDKVAMDRLKQVREKLTALDAAVPFLTLAMTMEEDPHAGKNYVRIRGDFKRNGDEAPADTPSFLPRMAAGLPHNRLGLAAWIMSPENPLTARVAVNRMWQEFFGIGLVRTSEDFGKQGEMPSHPELLDWLATEFRLRGWSMKTMHRLIVTSSTYRQSSETRKELQGSDPENRLLARQSRRRLPSELIRDEALAAGGLLNPAVGGPSMRPPQPAGVSELSYANSVKWSESKGPERYRRGLYIHFQRTSPYPQLMNFDSPDSMTACSRRRVSDTPLQALNLLNDSVFFEAAQGLAARVLQESPPAFDARLREAYLLVLGRAPSAQEQARLSQYFAQQEKLLRAEPETAAKLFPLHIAGVDGVEAAAWTGLSRVLLNLDEFVTRE